MNHELRTPLSAILGIAKIIKTELTNLDEHHIELFDDLLNASEHLLSIINDILDFSKLESGQYVLYKEAFDLRSVIEKALQTLNYQAKQKKLELSFSWSYNLPQYVISVEKFIQRIIFNIVGNAIKFTEEGGFQLKLNL